MALNLSPLLEKLRVAGPDLIVGIMGVPIAFTFQRIAEKVSLQELTLSKARLYVMLGILVLCYLISALIILDLTYRFDRRSVPDRAMQATLTLIVIGLIFALGNEGDDPARLHLLLSLCIMVILLMPLPRPDREVRSADRDDIVYLLLCLLGLAVPLFLMIP